MPRLSSNGIPRNTRHQTNPRPMFAGFAPQPAPEMSAGLRGALVKVGLVALLCVATIVALQQPAPPTVASHSEEAPRAALVQTTPAAESVGVQEAPRESANRLGDSTNSGTVVEVRRAERVTRDRAEEPRAFADEPRPLLNPFFGNQTALDSAPPAPPTRPPAPVSDWTRYRLIPGQILRIRTGGRPCTVRTDTTMEIFPNHPSMPRRIVAARSGLRFPLHHGQGPMSIYATPLGGAEGTIELRFDDEDTTTPSIRGGAEVRFVAGNSLRR